MSAKNNIASVLEAPATVFVLFYCAVVLTPNTCLINARPYLRSLLEKTRGLQKKTKSSPRTRVTGLQFSAQKFKGQG